VSRIVATGQAGRELRVPLPEAKLLSLTTEDRLWMKALFGGPILFEVASDDGSQIRCRLCRQEWHRSAAFGLYAQETGAIDLPTHLGQHLNQIPLPKRDSIFTLIRLGSEWAPACKEILGVSPLERDEWIRFWRLPEP
jgi:hypothetical protein